MTLEEELMIAQKENLIAQTAWFKADAKYRISLAKAKEMTLEDALMKREEKKKKLEQFTVPGTNVPRQAKKRDADDLPW
jgi:hypothetical protein